MLVLEFCTVHGPMKQYLLHNPRIKCYNNKVLTFWAILHCHENHKSDLEEFLYMKTIISTSLLQFGTLSYFEVFCPYLSIKFTSKI